MATRKIIIGLQRTREHLHASLPLCMSSTQEMTFNSGFEVVVVIPVITQLAFRLHKS